MSYGAHRTESPPLYFLCGGISQPLVMAGRLPLQFPLMVESLLQFCDGGIPSILEVWSKAQGQETALFCGFQEWST